jgi:hypothetical protein
LLCPRYGPHCQPRKSRPPFPHALIQQAANCVVHIGRGALPDVPSGESEPPRYPGAQPSGIERIAYDPGPRLVEDGSQAPTWPSSTRPTMTTASCAGRSPPGGARPRPVCPLMFRW